MLHYYEYLSPDALDALDRNCTLRVQFVGIPLVALLLAILKPWALVVLKETVLAAEMAGAESTVTDDTLSGILAVLEATAYLLRWHTAAQRQGEVYRGLTMDRVVGKCQLVIGEMFPGKDESKIRRRKVGSKSQEGPQCCDGCS